MSATSSNSEIKFSEIRRNFTVEYFFESVMGQVPRVFHTGVRYRGCPACGSSEDTSSFRVVIRAKGGVSRWQCFACDESGDVLDAARLHYECSVLDAAYRLNRTTPSTVRNLKIKPRKLLSEAPKRDDEAIQNVIKKLIDAKLPITNLVKEYLQSRGFSEQLIEEAYRRGMLVALPSHANKAKEVLYDLCGQDLLIRAGMLRESSKAPACAFRHFAFITHNARAIEFRLTRQPKENETKWISYGPMSPFFWQGESSDSYIITEGMSDLLSAVALGSKQSVIGLPGCKRWNPSWFARMRGKTVTSALDGDQSGINAMNGKSEEDIAKIEDEAMRLRASGLNKTLEHFGANVDTFQFPEDFLAVTEDSQKDLNGFLKWTLQAKGLL